MRRITKSAPPDSLVTYARERGASFEEMDTEIKEHLKISLLNEQNWVCGYCQQLIKDISKVKIEHHCEQSICNGEKGYPDRRLDYTNLMAVCFGNFGSNDLHCDSNKARFNANNGLPIQVLPWNNAHMACIKYHSTGKVDSTNDIHTIEIDSILNLNIKYLKELRRNKYTLIYKLSRHNNLSVMKAKMKRILEADLTKSGVKFSNPFPGLSEYMINKFC